jgi:ubiquinone/menaquinone biosynthesis C-methylase UbiE
MGESDHGCWVEGGANAMINISSEINSASATKYDKLHFGMIRIVHEGLSGGQRVLEVGCGPGFFTIPAAKIAGGSGHVYALDINPVAVEHVQRKIAHAGLGNVEARLADASETGLPSQSVDVVFLFGVMHAFKDVSKVLREMHRVLRSKGTLSIRSGVPADKLVETVSADGLFSVREEIRGLCIFEKIGGDGR